MVEVYWQELESTQHRDVQRTAVKIISISIFSQLGILLLVHLHMNLKKNTALLKAAAIILEVQKKGARMHSI